MNFILSSEISVSDDGILGHDFLRKFAFQMNFAIDGSVEYRFTANTPTIKKVGKIVNRELELETYQPNNCEILPVIKPPEINDEVIHEYITSEEPICIRSQKLVKFIINEKETSCASLEC